MTSVCHGQIYWKKIFERVECYYSYVLTQLIDGNYLVAGGKSGNVYLFKITPFGDTLWTKTYGRTGYNCANAIASTPDGNFIVAGCSNAVGCGVYLLKINQNGDTLWTKTYGGTGKEVAYAITTTPDGNSIVAGVTFSSIGAGYIYLLKINSDGDTLWTKTFGGSSFDCALAVKPMADGNFIVSGKSESFDGGRFEMFLLKITPKGDAVWEKNYDIDIGMHQSITPTSDGNFIIAGGNSSIYIVKITPQGDTLWTKIYGGNDNDCATAIRPTLDGNFIVAGNTASLSYTTDSYFLKITPQGDTLWHQIFKENYFNYTSDIIPTFDGNFIAVGYSGFVLVNGGVCTDIWSLSIIDDRYAKKNSLFTFKIPASGDSLKHTYTPINVPSGMAISVGGTLSWMPVVDSAHIKHISIGVSDTNGRIDTLTFNIVINTTNEQTIIDKRDFGRMAKNGHISIDQQSSSRLIFTLPSGVSTIEIYDINGHSIRNLIAVNRVTLWNCLNTAGNRVPSGRYLAKIIANKNICIFPFSINR
jgi:hypothetical protein